MRDLIQSQGVETTYDTNQVSETMSQTKKKKKSTNRCHERGYYSSKESIVSQVLLGSVVSQELIEA